MPKSCSIHKPKARSEAQKQITKELSAACYGDQTNSLAPKTDFNASRVTCISTLTHQLAISQAETSHYRDLQAETTFQLKSVQDQLLKAKSELRDQDQMTTALQKKIKSVKKQSIHHHTLLHYEQRKVARSEKSKLKVVEELHSFQLHTLPEAQNRLSESLLQMSQLKEMTQSENDELICQLNDLSAESEKLHSAAIVSQKRINALIKMVL